MNALSVILVAFFTAAITATGMVYIVERYDLIGPGQPEKRGVPSLIGLTEADAKTNLQTNGLKLLVAGREGSSSAQPGTVIRQSPEVGQLIAPGQAVSVTFAAEMPKVPNVVGRTVEDATRTLEGAGFAVRVGDRLPSADVPEGNIAEQTPEAGSALQKEGRVTLRASSGPGEIEVPKLTGMGVTKAKEEAEKANLKLAIQWVSLAETASNIALRQIPEAGTKVKPDSEVKIVVNRD